MTWSRTPPIGCRSSTPCSACRWSVPAGRLPAVVEVSVYFFCSEALTNVVKHARATSARVRIELDAGHCAVEVRDDGVGGARPRLESSGLVGLRDRIGALDGTMDIIQPGGRRHSAPGRDPPPLREPPAEKHSEGPPGGKGTVPIDFVLSDRQRELQR